MVTFEIYLRSGGTCDVHLCIDGDLIYEFGTENLEQAKRIAEAFKRVTVKVEEVSEDED